MLSPREKPNSRSASAVRETTPYKGGEVWTVDLMDFMSIRKFVDRFHEEGGGHLDLLVLNSGINTNKYTPSADGWEATYVP